MSSIQVVLFDEQGSNPFPFLLWIATALSFSLAILYKWVVTLFHFYCGLRLQMLNAVAIYP